MKIAKTVVAAMLCGVLSSVCGADDPSQPTTSGPESFDGYELSWHEEFNGDRVAPDPANWDYELGKVRNNEWQDYTRGNARCEDGRLVITAKKESDGSFTSSSLVTKGYRHFLYGKYVFRARIPTFRGAWPCMWMMGRNYNWPSCGEIDIQEMYWKSVGGTPKPVLLCNMCWNASSGMWNPVWNITERTVESLDAGGAEGWSSKYHVWVMDWDCDSIKIYLDGNLLCQQDLSQAINQGEWGEGTKGKCPFREPQYILLNLPVGGDAGGKFGVDESQMPWQMEVDYIRVYRKVGTTDGLQPVDVIDRTPGAGADYAADASAPVTPSGYHLAWHDEFDGSGSPSSENWKVEKGAAASVGNGLLVMTAQKSGKKLTEAYVNTKGLRSFTKGILEIRARTPVTRGVLAQAWVESADTSPGYGFAEAIDARYLSGGACIATWVQWATSGGDWYDRTLMSFVERDPKWAAKFHVWKIVVDASQFTLYLDGERFYGKSISSMTTGGSCPFGNAQNPMYVGLKLAYNTDQATLDEDSLPDRFEVDYVRCYEPGPSEWPTVGGVETPTPQAFLAAAKDGMSVVLAETFAWDGRVLKKGGSAWATLPELYVVSGGVVSLDAARVRPVVGAAQGSSSRGIELSSGKVEINVVNAKAGLYYGYVFATTPLALADAEPTWAPDPAASDGDFLLSAGTVGAAGFYRVTVGDRAPSAAAQ